MVIDDHDPPPSVAGQDTSVTEPASGSVPVPVTFLLDRPSGRDVTLSVQTVDGTADSSDYTPVSTRVTIPAGSRRAEVVVSVLADVAPELPETFGVTVTAAQNAKLAANAVVTINPPTP